MCHTSGFSWAWGHHQVDRRLCLWDDGHEAPPQNHVFFVHDLGVPPWPCPLCGCPGAARHPYAESSDQHEQHLQQLQAHLLGISREVNDVFGGPPGVVIGPPIAGSILPTGTTQQPQDFAFNPLTAIHGEFVPGEMWRHDGRSRRQKAIDRNRRRIEEAERDSRIWAAENADSVARSVLRPDAPSFEPPGGRFRGGHRGRSTGSRPRGPQSGRGQ